MVIYFSAPISKNRPVIGPKNCAGTKHLKVHFLAGTCLKSKASCERELLRWGSNERKSCPNGYIKRSVLTTNGIFRTAGNLPIYFEKVRFNGSVFWRKGSWFPLVWNVLSSETRILTKRLDFLSWIWIGGTATAGCGASTRFFCGRYFACPLRYNFYISYLASVDTKVKF